MIPSQVDLSTAWQDSFDIAIQMLREELGFFRRYSWTTVVAEFEGKKSLSFIRISPLEFGEFSQMQCWLHICTADKLLMFM